MDVPGGQHAPADRTRINVNDAEDLRYWTAELGCSETDLRAAVDSVGVMTDDISRYLARR